MMFGWLKNKKYPSWIEELPEGCFFEDGVVVIEHRGIRGYFSAPAVEEFRRVHTNKFQFVDEFKQVVDEVLEGEDEGLH